MTLATYTCKHCGEEFEAHPSARTADLGYCSQECLTAATEDRASPR